MPFKVINLIKGNRILLSYNELSILEFIHWVKNERGVSELNFINKNSLIEYLVDFYKSRNIDVDLNGIGLALRSISNKNSIINLIKEKIGIATAKNIENVYFECYEVKYSAMILFPFHNRNIKIEFFENYGKDLDAISSNVLNIFYSENDTLQKSGYEIANESIGKTGQTIKLPAILIWKTREGIASYEAISLEGISGIYLLNFFEQLINLLRQDSFVSGKLHEGIYLPNNINKIAGLNNITSIKNNISKNNLLEAFTELHEYTLCFHAEKLNDFIILKSSYERVRRSEMLGMLSGDEAMLNYNRLNLSLLNLIESFNNS